MSAEPDIVVRAVKAENVRLKEENKALKEQIKELERLKGVRWRGPWRR